MSKPRRQSFLKACQRISQYYDSMNEDSPMESQSLTAQQSIALIKENLWTDPAVRRTRKEKIQIMIRVFEILLRSDELMRTNPRFRQTVYAKINETMDEIKTYKERIVNEIEENVDNIQMLLSIAARTMTGADQLSLELDQWKEKAESLKEDTEYLESLFSIILHRQAEYASI